MLWKPPFQFVFTVIGIFMIGSLQYLFFGNEIKSMRIVLDMLRSGELWNADFLGHDIGFHFSAFYSHIIDTIAHLPALLEVKYYQGGRYLPLFPTFFEKYLYSMEVLAGALVIGLLAAVVFTYMVMLLSKRIRRLVYPLLFFLESLPDIFVILILQTLIIWVYQETGIKVFDILATDDDPAYGLPIVCLSILPAIFLIKHLVQMFEDEAEKPYVNFARGKGLRKSTILLVHIFRNTLIVLFYEFKTIFWFALSNLLVLEMLLNMKGFMWFMWTYAITPHILTIGLLMVFLPFFIFFSIGHVIIEKGGFVQHDSETV